ncbi:MAG: TrkH family potassium uptake protein [Muribaculaceae bacterium]|nr:TrkH family potassium uptake protein [Muribaculaceae bacterium]
MIRAEKPLINIAQLLRIIGLLMIFEAFFLIIPTLTCVYYGEKDWIPFGGTTILTAVIGILMLSRIRPRTGHMSKRDGFLLTALVWIVFSIFGMLPFLTCSTPLSISDAFFESMSGFTTTGASVLDNVSGMSHGILLWRAMMQWIGGMGIILFTLAVVPMLNHSGGMQMFNAEVTGITHDKIRPRISQTAKSLWTVYLTLTVILVLLLWAGPMDFFDSICHAFGAISTGGFSTESFGIVAYHSDYVKIVLTIFMFIGGVNFALIYKTVSGNTRAIRHNDVLRAYVMTIAIYYVLFAITIISRGQCNSWQDITINPIFQIVSTITSTGYSSVNYEAWGPFVLALMFVLMFTGACAGSTSGGAKIDRMLYLIKNCRNEIYRCIHPNAILSVRINGNVINPDIVSKVIAFLCIYMLLIVAGGLTLSALDVPLIDSFFSAFSCISNTGLGAGVTGYGSSYEILPDAAKWVLSLLMLIGRLEIFTVLLLFTRVFWRK